LARTVRHFVPDFNTWLDAVPEPRCCDRITYPGRFLRGYGVLLFAGKRGRRRPLDFKYREQGACVLDHLNRLAQTEQDSIPCHDPLADYLAQIKTAPVASGRAERMGRLIRSRTLDAACGQGRLVLGLDGTGYLVFRWRHWEPCLTRPGGERTLDCHQVLDAKVLGPAATVRSLGSAFLDNRELADGPGTAGEQKRKQDGALKAARRLLAAGPKDCPQWWLCLSLDALYAGGAGFALGKEFNVALVVVFKEGRIPTW
jgi:hypothetical protein